STMAALRSLGTMLRIVVILAASMLSGGPAHAGRTIYPSVPSRYSLPKRQNVLVYQNIGYARCCTSKAVQNSEQAVSTNCCRGRGKPEILSRARTNDPRMDLSSDVPGSTQRGHR